MLNLLWLLLLALVALHFWQTHGLRERVLLATAQYCRRHALMLLDQSVALRGLWWQRDGDGRLRVRRRWQFEFSVTGGERYTGTVITLGMRIKTFELPPHRFVDAPPSAPLEQGPLNDGNTLEHDDNRTLH